uniref:F-box only protein 21-like n=1 Tax=Sinocyclocheilus rhinocerous TaxID=307959 RepID=A0A673H917_9TELE
QRFYQQNESYDWLKEFKTRHVVGQQIRRTVESISKRFFTEVVSGFKRDSITKQLIIFSKIVIFLVWKCLTLKYYAKKILYFLRQQNILRNLKVFLERPPEQQSALEGAVLIDQYCNPLADTTLESISAQIEEITDKVKKYLRVKNATHPSDCFVLENLEFQRQVICALNAVLYDQLQYKGNERDYYNPLNSYIHQVLLRRTGIPISLSVLYMTLARKLGVPLEPVNFPNHFLLRWCQYQRREGNEKSYQLLRDSLDLYLTINPDNVQYLLLQARLYFHLGIWPEKVLDILQHIQALDPTQHGAVGYLVQHTLEHIQHKRHPVEPEVKRHSAPEHRDVQYSVGLIMKHKRSGYNCVIYGWDPKCTMSQEWINTMRVHQLSKGADQPFYNVLVQDGTCRYAAQENLEPHSAPLEIAHPEVGRYFTEFSDTHYIANEELQSRYPEDMCKTHRTVEELYHGLNHNSGQSPEPTANFQDHDLLDP